jgi:predicted deacetylase
MRCVLHQNILLIEKRNKSIKEPLLFSILIKYVLYPLLKMIDKKLSLVTIHDVNPSCAEKLQKITDALKKLNIKYNLSIVPNYNKKYNLKDNPAFCDQISTLLQSDTKVELTLHGLYHQIGENIEDFDSQSKEEEIKDIKQGLDIQSSVRLPRLATSIPPAWYLSRQAIEALKDFEFEIAEARSVLEFINKRRKYIISPVMNWDKQGDKEKNKQMLEQNKKEFYTHLFNIGGQSYGLFRMAIHPPHDPDEALADQIKMIEYLKEKESYKFINYSDLIE